MYKSYQIEIAAQGKTTNYDYQDIYNLYFVQIYFTFSCIVESIHSDFQLRPQWLLIYWPSTTSLFLLWYSFYLLMFTSLSLISTFPLNMPRYFPEDFQGSDSFCWMPFKSEKQASTPDNQISLTLECLISEH